MLHRGDVFKIEEGNEVRFFRVLMGLGQNVLAKEVRGIKRSASEYSIREHFLYHQGPRQVYHIEIDETKVSVEANIPL